MGAGTLDFGRLVSAFHDLSLKNRYLRVFEPLGHLACLLAGPFHGLFCRLNSTT
jgi:hypothetical protein